MRVRGTGILPNDIVLIGEAPGFKEDQTGRPFVGKSGAELTRYLERAYLDRNDLYITNLVKLQPPVINGKQTAPTVADIERDVPELMEELAAAKPKWIGAIGRVAAQWLADVGSMESCHGLAYPLKDEVRMRLLHDTLQARRVAAELANVAPPSGRKIDFPLSEDDRWIEDVRVVPIHHPAAALHNPELQPLVWWDIQQFSKYVRGVLEPIVPIDRHTAPCYKQEFLAGKPGGPIGVDTEGSVAAPWSVQVSLKAGTGGVFKAGELTTASRINDLFGRSSAIVLQNALHDVDVLAAMGIELDWDRVEDTFLMADVLRLVPRGLKAGAQRDCGIQMRSYSSVIAPAEARLAREWAQRAIEARRCSTCNGSGKVVDEEKAARRALQTLKSGRTFKTTPEVKCAVCVDGGMWRPRGGELDYDWESGVYVVKSGWEVQRYLNALQRDLEAGKFDTSLLDDDNDGDDKSGEAVGESPKKRVRQWPAEVVSQLEEAVGPLPQATLDDVPLDEAVNYAARDADATLRRYPILRRQVEELGLYDAYRLDLDVMPVAAEMQRNGMRINRQYFADLSAELKERKLSIADELRQLVGRGVNPGSGDQVAELLYGKRRLDFTDADAADFRSLTAFELTPEKFTRSGKRGSTDDKTLEGLKLKYAEDAEIVRTIQLVLDYRMCDKIDGTYAEKMPRVADKNDRVHTRIKIGPATFRWASADPNLQNIPTREKHGEDLGRRVRLGFEAPEGYVMGSRDFDQVEMRVLAWYAQDKTLLRLFRDGPTCSVTPMPGDSSCRCHDIHYVTASLTFRTPLEQVTRAQRTSAKNIGFGVVYGVTARGLKAQMELRGQHWTLEECQALITSYLYEAYPGIGVFMDEAHAEARRNGMVRSLAGHLRYTPAVHSSVASIREEALRQAANFKIQCSSAELLKMSMRDMWRACRERFRELDVKVLMAIHDELLMETPDDAGVIEEVDALMSAYMTNPYPLDGVEITSGSKWNRAWGMLK